MTYIFGDSRPSILCHTQLGKVFCLMPIKKKCYNSRIRSTQYLGPKLFLKQLFCVRINICMFSHLESLSEIHLCI